ncbi:hypothetical protein [uncultured Clostridium sp.]|jgi:hypothetical protein|uniref:hypothetical protein n=1 Tax=uncultured Clostridium sp. TaxID=59620 RepID=UPI002613AB49|nr:hypothetical protein [uncultured Clostridium sp.]
MALISFIGSVFLIGLIIGILMGNLNTVKVTFALYAGTKVLENIIWRCPKCKSKLPRGSSTNTISKCLYCNYELI